MKFGHSQGTAICGICTILLNASVSSVPQDTTTCIKSLLGVQWTRSIRMR